MRISAVLYQVQVLTCDRVFQYIYISLDANRLFQYLSLDANRLSFDANQYLDAISLHVYVCIELIYPASVRHVHLNMHSER